MSLRLFSSFIIKNQKPCVNCVNYIKYKYTYPHDEIYDSETKLGTCSLFGEQNVVTGNIIYEDALKCRINSFSCGINGKYYYPKDDEK